MCHRMCALSCVYRVFTHLIFVCMCAEATVSRDAPATRPLPFNISERYTSLLQTEYGEVFTLRDGSSLVGMDTRAIGTMLASVQRLLALAPGQDMLSSARSLPDSEMIRVLFLAVAGNFTVAQTPSALPQRCALVVDGQTGELILRDDKLTQSVILEVLLIVSIVCLMRAWAEQSG